ncbi:Nucleosome remodeling factor, subunit CAF1/NURF55/MSI1 [Handroanthus impetiginosus]|uniref:Nucleosome remodeling factor, subunit CAF1/NURF55/MSI1 n=1 Tax=Handroanthus impetiginosus TaxID=429701 RepID=A0A2G9HGB3_9LAMI|nr:Nucleosome remodeling factor, subunit CAF1/NURF55/MSI1 [Handroanthus impetiginosus]
MNDPSSSSRSSTTITDLDMDTLTRCASYLSLRDISNMAMSCKYLKTAAYCDSIWQSLYRQEWPKVVHEWPPQASSIRETYLSRHRALHQFKYLDPLRCDIYRVGKPPHHILFEKNSVIFSQGSSIYSFDTDDLMNRSISVATRGNHNARVTCMRLFSLSEPYKCQSASERNDNILITSSSDHFIRLWSKGGSRCFKGHTGPVLTLSDKLLGDDGRKMFARGGEDGTVRLWSIYSSGKRGQHALKATLHGHEKAVSLMSVAGHKAALLVSISKNGKVRVWDTSAASSSIRSSCCVGMTSVPISPVGVKCHESLLYVAAGSSVTAVDLRTMQRVFTVVQQVKIHSFDLLPSKSLLCTGGTGRAMLWDVRRVSNTFKAEPTIELNGLIGPVKLLHMDFHRVVTGGPDDPCVLVWEPETGTQTNSLLCSDRTSGVGCSAMAVDGCRIVTASSPDEHYDNDYAILRFRDFRSASIPVSPNPSEASSTVSKFWGPQSDSDSEESDWQ